MADIVVPRDIPADLMAHALSNVDQTIDAYAASDGDPCDAERARDIVCGVLHAAGLHLIDEATQAELARELCELLPADPYGQRDAVDKITWAVLYVMGVTAL